MIVFKRNALVFVTFVIALSFMLSELALSFNVNPEHIKEGDQDVLIIQTDSPASCILELESGNLNLRASDSDNKTFRYFLSPVNQTIEGICESLENPNEKERFKIDITVGITEKTVSDDIDETKNEAPKESFKILFVEPSEYSTLYENSSITIKTSTDASCSIKIGNNKYGMESLDNRQFRINVSSFAKELRNGNIKLVFECNTKYGLKTESINYVFDSNGKTSTSITSGSNDNREMTFKGFEGEGIMDFFNWLFNLLIEFLPIALQVAKDNLIIVFIAIVFVVVIISLAISRKFSQKNNEKKRMKIPKEDLEKVFFPEKSDKENNKGNDENSIQKNKNSIKKLKHEGIDMRAFAEFDYNEANTDDKMKKDIKEKDEIDKEKNKRISDRWIHIYELIRPKKKEKPKMKNQEDPIGTLQKEIYLEEIKGKTELNVIFESLKSIYEDSHDTKIIKWAINKLFENNQIKKGDAVELVNMLKEKEILDDMQALDILSDLNLI